MEELVCLKNFFVFKRALLEGLLFKLVIMLVTEENFKRLKCLNTHDNRVIAGRGSGKELG